MGRPRGSRNRPADNSDNPTLRGNTVNGDELLAYIERIEACNKEQKVVSSDRQQVFKELKQAGYNRDTVRAIVAERKLSAEECDLARARMAEYQSALGEYSNTPLGRAMRPDREAA
jgi:uncharacterized protein (UPF0335 family)